MSRIRSADGTGSARRVLRVLARLVVCLLALVGLLAAGFAAVVLWAADDDVAWERVVPEFLASITELRAASDLPGDGLREGRDYAFLRTEQGRLVHWHCGDPIPVVLIGTAPAGAETLLTEATALLAEKTGLPLVPRYQPDGPRTIDGAITVLYGDLTGDAAIGFAEELAQSGTAYHRNGRIAYGEVTILTGSPQAGHTLPAENGREALVILLHELAHAIGVSHSAPGASGIMTPALDPGDLELSAGDEFALRAIGCPG